MRSRAIGLAAALVAAVLVPAAALSQAKKGGGEISEAQRKQGMAEAPAVVQSLGLACTVSDARYVGKQEDKKAKTSTSFYEVACSQGMGFVLQAPTGGQATAFTCIEANTPPEGAKEAALPCKLPANSDPKAVLTPMLQQAGAACTPERVRGIGQGKTQSFFEVACQGGEGYVLITASPFDNSKPATAQNCLNFDDAAGNIKCTLSDAATRLAVVDKYAATTQCAVKDRRFVGTSKDGDSFFEASCQDGKGYIYKVKNGAVTQNWDCAKAQGVLGGCTLTDARQAQSEQAGLYTRLAKNAGGNCEVEKYAMFPMRGQEEVVELVCKDGTGGVGIFPASGKGQFLGCGHALVAGYKCGLTTNVDYSGLTADLKKNNVASCVVSNSRLMAKTQKGTTLVEVACADGYKGYVLEYNTTPTVTAIGATGCAFAGGCKLPGNV
ncbi:hypothetical protein [Phenylobacterium sp. J367]|uniref:hypothetical protein n=1 Tax=Phenylobacterium sp. J367 TaxID=2898435 RepID=UPI002150EF1B|nr:hypothetical protein [Phenylobacterium sp. J367]MCR5877434.1 hypothetical protein [Phenylobacterium sp. J367]